jgi:hypothetical protein
MKRDLKQTQILHDELRVGTLKEQLASPRDNDELKYLRFLKLREFVMSMLDLKKENKGLAGGIVDNEGRRILYNKLTMQLEADLDDGSILNETLKMQAEQMSKLKESHESHRNQAFNYCSTLKDKLKGFVETVYNVIIIDK